MDGEVDVAAEMAGTLNAVFVKEGDWVTEGTVLAEVDARREMAAFQVAERRLARVIAGIGAEEIAAKAAARDAVEAELNYSQLVLRRAENLLSSKVTSQDDFDEKDQRVNTLRNQVASLQQEYEAMKRGPLPEEIALAKAEVEAARVTHDLRNVRARRAGVILNLYRHAGDSVSLNPMTPILRMANTRRLQVRVEVSELDVSSVETGTVGTFSPFGQDDRRGDLLVETILPTFVPRRLFDPDSTARLDTRTLHVLCSFKEQQIAVYSGQRVTVTLRHETP